ncbi:MAG: pectate lyase [Bacteroidetes bacterium]|nr:pectate lyase [Bacteroidota bacterium]
MNIARKFQHGGLRTLAVIGAILCTHAASGQVWSSMRDTLSLEPFRDGAHHWYDVADEERVIRPVEGQRRYAKDQVREISDNILLYQKSNGGWPKNYDMQAILTNEQRALLSKARHDDNTTFDNGATHSQVQYLAEAFTRLRREPYKSAALRGIEFILAAQQPGGGWPQFFPDTTGYRRYITFNDGAMIGVMRILCNIAEGKPEYVFLDENLRARSKRAYRNGLGCILRCQIADGNLRTGWCQQHDDRTLAPRPARTYELASTASLESAEIVKFLMDIRDPSPEIVAAIQNATSWLARSRILGIRAPYKKAPKVRYQFHEAAFDRVAVIDPDAPPLWARYYELGTNVPLFANRDGKPVYTLGEVDRERRTGYAWYTEDPATVLARYPAWQVRHAPEANVLFPDTLAKMRAVPKDTSFTTYSAWQKVLADYPSARPAAVSRSRSVLTLEGLVYAEHGYRHLALDVCVPADVSRGPFPAVMLIHGGGWRSGDKSQELPMAEALAERGFVAVTVEYRLSPEALYPAGVHDLKTALRWMRAHAAEYNMRSDRIAVMGGSAGGTLAAILGTTAGMESFDGTGAYSSQTTEVQAVIDMDGILDFTDPAESGKDTDPAKPSAGSAWFGGPFREKPGVWKEASPVQWVSANSPPFLVVNSSLPRFRAGRDSVISRLERFGIPAEVYEFPDAPHPFWLLHPWVDTVREKVVEFLHAHLRQD